MTAAFAWPGLLSSLYDVHDLYTHWPSYQVATMPREPSPYYEYWNASPDSYSLKIRLPELEPDSISASLASESATLEVTGKRKFDGCTCEKTVVREVKLPYRPRPEDIEVTVLGADALSLKLARGSKADAPTPIKVNVERVDETKKGWDKVRELRFVPHASATAEGDQKSDESKSLSVQEQEKTLTERFRNVAQAAVALNSEETGADKAEPVEGGDANPNESTPKA